MKLSEYSLQAFEVSRNDGFFPRMWFVYGVGYFGRGPISKQRSPNNVFYRKRTPKQNNKEECVRTNIPKHIHNYKIITVIKYVCIFFNFFLLFRWGRGGAC